jgi:hypothetical protein
LVLCRSAFDYGSACKAGLNHGVRPVRCIRHRGGSVSGCLVAGVRWRSTRRSSSGNGRLPRRGGGVSSKERHRIYVVEPLSQRFELNGREARCPTLPINTG